jgi:tetratricopeptide (TPR) repeat protein
MKRSILTFFCLLSVASSQQPGSLFKDPDFQKRFMGSFGFLPEVEPTIDPESEEKKAYLLEIKDLLAADNMTGLKAKLQQDLDPQVSDAALQFMYANIWFQEGNNSEAEKWYTSAIRKFPSYLRAYKNLGLVHYQTGANAKAIESLSKAVELGDRSAQTIGLLGLCHLSQEDWMPAETALRQAMVLEPKRPQWRKALLQAFFGAEQYDAAHGMLTHMIDEKPDDTNLWLMKGRALMELKRSEEATMAFETLRHMGSAKPEILEILGAIYMDLEKPNAALSAYQAAAKGSKKLKGSSVLRTANLLFGYQYTDQAKSFVTALRPRVKELTDQEQLDLRTLEAKIARAEGDDSRASSILQDIILKDNRNGDARIELAQFFERQAKNTEDKMKKAEYFARATLYFEQAMQIETTEALAALRFGQMLVGKSDFVKAVPLLQKSYQLRPKDEVDQYIKRVQRAARRQEAKDAELKRTLSKGK